MTKWRESFVSSLFFGFLREIYVDRTFRVFCSHRERRDDDMARRLLIHHNRNPRESVVFSCFLHARVNIDDVLSTRQSLHVKLVGLLTEKCFFFMFSTRGSGHQFSHFSALVCCFYYSSRRCENLLAFVDKIFLAPWKWKTQITRKASEVLCWFHYISGWRNFGWWRDEEKFFLFSHWSMRRAMGSAIKRIMWHSKESLHMHTRTNEK